MYKNNRYVLDDFPNVFVPVGSHAGIPDARVLEVVLVVRLQKLFSADVETLNLG